MQMPIANQISNLHQLSRVKDVIKKTQTIIPKIGISGTNGTLNLRSAFGIFLRILLGYTG